MLSLGLSLDITSVRGFRIAGTQQNILKWSGLASSNNWSSGTNWNAHRKPKNNDSLIFAGVKRLTPVNNISGLSLNNITFAIDAGAFAISGNEFINNDNSKINNNSSNSQSIANPIVLGNGSLGITVNAANANITLSGVVSGNNTLIKTGANILTLSGANTYIGNTTIAIGTLKAGNDIALSSSSAFSIESNATLDLNGYNNTIKGFTSSTANGTITNSSGSSAKLTIATAIPTVAGSLSNSIAQLFTGNLSLQLYGGSTGNSILTNENNTYNGGTTLGKGTTDTTTRVIFGNGTFGAGSPGAITSGIFGTGAVTVGANTADKAQLYFSRECTFNYDIIVNSALGDTVYPGAIRMESSDGTVTLTGTIKANQADIVMITNNRPDRTAVVTGIISGNYGLQIFTRGVAVPPSPGTGTLILTLANPTENGNTYSGNTTIGYGNTTFSTDKATLKLGAANQIPNGAGKGNLIIYPGTFNLNGFNETINGLVGSGTIDGMSGTPTLTVGDNNTTCVFSGVIKNTAGTLSLVKIGAGTLTLSGVNTYGGSTSITDGTLVVTAVTSDITATATFNPTVLAVTFSSTPISGQQYQFFKGSTEHEYTSVSLNGALGLTGTYNSANSTLTIA